MSLYPFQSRSEARIGLDIGIVRIRRFVRWLSAVSFVRCNLFYLREFNIIACAIKPYVQDSTAETAAPIIPS